MKDLSSKISSARSLLDIEEAMTAERRVSDETRRSLVMRVAKARIPKQDRQAAYEAVMGPLSSVLNEQRCLDWWDAVVHSPESVRAAIARKLPFKPSVVQEGLRVDFIEKLIVKGKSDIALMVWREAADDASRTEMLSGMLDILSKDPPQDVDPWREDISRLLLARPTGERVDAMCLFFCGAFLAKNLSKDFMDPWLASVFPGGISTEICSRFVSGVAKHMNSQIPELESQARNYLKPLRVVFNHNELDDATPKATQATTSRRI